MRKEFELSPEQLDRVLQASRPVPYIVCGGKPPPSPQENANAVWQSIGRELGFEWMTVKPVEGKNHRFFTALPALAKVDGGV